MGTLKLNNVILATESGGTVVLDSATVIPAAGVTGTLPNAVQDNITRLGTVASGVIGSGVTGGAGLSTSIDNNSITLAKMTANSVDSDQYVDGSIDTDHIGDDQVTLAKMAGGTDGQIITYDANGDPVAVGPGTDGQVLTSTGASSPPAFEDAAGGGGLEEVDMWRLTTSYDAPYEHPHHITSNLARVSGDGFGLLGTGMSESSGVFTFPSTGYWLVDFNATFYDNVACRYNEAFIVVGPVWNPQSGAVSYTNPPSSSDVYSSCSTSAFIDVTSTSSVQVKFRITIAYQADAWIKGSSSITYTGMRFIKVGDT